MRVLVKWYSRTCSSITSRTYFNHESLEGQLKHCILFIEEMLWCILLIFVLEYRWNI